VQVERLWLALLVTLDRLLGTDLISWVLNRRLAELKKWRSQLAQLNQEIALLEQQIALTRLNMCLLLLQRRALSLPDNWLCFDDRDQEDEQALKMVIPTLVTPRLARLKTEAVGEKKWRYHLIPDWPAIAAAIESPDSEPIVVQWVAQQIKLSASPSYASSPLAEELPG